MSALWWAGVVVIGGGVMGVGVRIACAGLDDVVFCGSVGLGVQDAAAAWAVVRAAWGTGR